MKSAQIIIFCIALVTIPSFTMYSFVRGTDAVPVQFDFETDAELNKLMWQCRTIFSLSEEYATSGSHSLRIEWHPNDYARLEPIIKHHDWSTYKTLCFDIYNPEHKEVTIVIRINDQINPLTHYDSFIKLLVLKPGFNNITIPLTTIRTYDAHRALNLKTIYRFFLCMTHPARTYILYIDNLKLLS